MYGEEWTNANYKRDDMSKCVVITSLKFIGHKGSYNIFETDNGVLINVFSNQPSILRILRENPYDLYAVGLLNHGARYSYYKMELNGKEIGVSTVARIMPIMKGSEQEPRMVLLHSNNSLLPTVM